MWVEHLAAWLGCGWAHEGILDQLGKCLARRQLRGRAHKGILHRLRNPRSSHRLSGRLSPQPVLPSAQNFIALAANLVDSLHQVPVIVEMRLPVVGSLLSPLTFVPVPLGLFALPLPVVPLLLSPGLLLLAVPLLPLPLRLG